MKPELLKTAVDSEIVSNEEIASEMEHALLRVSDLINMPASHSSGQELVLYTQIIEKLELIIRVKKNMKLSTGQIIGITVAYQLIITMSLFFIVLFAVVINKWMTASLNLESTVTVMSMANEYIYFIWMAIIASALVPVFAHFIHPRIAKSKVDSIYKEVKDIKLDMSISNEASDYHA